MTFRDPSGQAADPQLDAAGNLKVALEATGPITLEVNEADLANVGAKADTAATTDTGSFSIIALIKRGLQNWTTLLGLFTNPAVVTGNITAAVAVPTLVNDLIANTSQSIAGGTVDVVTIRINSIAGGLATGTVSFFGTDDGVNLYPLSGLPIGGAIGSGSFVNSAAALGAWQVKGSAARTIYAVGTALAAGAVANVSLSATPNQSRVTAIGRGSFGGSQTAPRGTAPAEASVQQTVAAAPASYRTAVAAADVIAAPGAVTCTLVAGGSLAASAHTIFVVAGNVYGRTTATQGNATVTGDGGANKTARAAFAAVTGATFYDIYCSTDGAAAKFVGRITEAQRASGILLTAVSTTGAGGTAGAVDIQVPGTGLAVNGGQLTQNNAYAIPASPIDCSGYQYVDFDLSMSRTGDIVAPSLKVIPFFLNSRTSTYQAGDVTTISFGGASGAYQPNKQRLRIECRGNSGMALVVASIAGTGAAVDMDAAKS